MKKLLIFFLVLSLSGCKYAGEPDERSYVTAVGFDKGEKYDLRLTFVFAAPQKSDSKSSDKEEDETVVIEAPSLYSAIQEINIFMSKTVALTHIQTVVFSKELAAEGIGDYLYSLVRSNNFRPNTYVCIADKSASDFLTGIKPIQTKHLEKYFQLLFNSRNVGSYGDMYLYDAFFDINRANRTNILPYCSLNEQQIEDAPEKPSESQEKDSDSKEKSSEPNEEQSEPATEKPLPKDTDDFDINFVAGETVRKSANPAEILGVAILKDGVYKATIGRLEEKMLYLMTSTLPDTYFSVSDPRDKDKIIDIHIFQPHRAKINVDTKNNPKIQIEVDLEGDFVSVGDNDYYITHPSEFEDYFEEKVKTAIEMLLQKSSKELNCDICSFSEKAKLNFPTTEKWEEYNWDEKYKNAEFSVKVNIVMRTHGELAYGSGE